MNETLKKIWDLSQSNDINEYLIVTQSMASGISYEVQTLLDEISRLQALDRWIPVSERLPEIGKRKSLFDSQTNFHVYGELINEAGCKVWKTDVGRYHFTSITHWRPLPAIVRGAEIKSLLERRAEFVYNGARLAAQAANAPIIPVLWDEREQPFKDQFLKVIERQCGEQRSKSPEELHKSWMQSYFAMGWVYGEKYDREKKTHPDLVPYADLGQLERDKDAVFVVLCEIARQWIYDLPTIESEG